MAENQLKTNIKEIRDKLDTCLGLMKRTLNEYTELDYIESTGTQYIDTGIIPSKSLGFDVTFWTNDYFNDSSFGTIFGARTSFRSNMYHLTTYSSGYVGASYGHFGYANDVYEAKMLRQTKISMSYKNPTLTRRDNTTLTTNTSEINPNKNLLIFALNSGDANTPTELSHIRLYSLKLYNGEELIRDFIPVIRNIDNVVCFYDKVNGVYYTNQGTGTFIAGTPKQEVDEVTELISTALYHYESNDLKTNWRVDTGLSQSSLSSNTLLLKIKPTDWTYQEYIGLMGLHWNSNGWNIQTANDSSVEGGKSIGFTYGNGDNIASLPLFPLLPENETNIIVMSRDNTTAVGKLYKNGELLVTKENSTFSSYGNLYIGDSWQGNRYFHGYIYQVYVWDKQLTDLQVSYLCDYLKD